MNEIFYFFENITSQTRVLFLVGGLFLFLTLEFGIPFFKSPYNKLNHAKINITFTLITLIINLFGAIGILKAVDFVDVHNFGLLNIIEIPLWLYVLIGIVLIDFIGAWFVHWIQHKVRWMWKFHIIHHSDPNVDVTSGLRHHPGENIFRLLFTILAILIFGANFGLVMIYQTVSAFFAHFSHANIRIPTKIEYFLSYVFVTPAFHRIHHHYKQPQTDSNYGNIFSFWDYIFQTKKDFKNSNNIRYGVDTHMKKEEISSFINLLTIPFQPYRSSPK
tara:strand:+ start:207 stop:1031 length:825 start_codon:yes stop_codon:yes gene_type:complete